jgi:superfamily II DNA or RNA helicase
MATTKFFTNENGNTLIAKFEGIVQYLKPFYFDALVGYFRASGYFHIREMLRSVSQVRILVGIDVDALTAKYYDKGREIRFVAEDIRADFETFLRQDIQQSVYQRDVEDGIIQFVEDIASGKIQVRAHKDKRIHAKVYIFREKDKHDHGYGRVITGSSNLTDNGLASNFEFNVELRDNSDVDFAVETFEKLWAESVEILPAQANEIKQKTYLKDDFTPFEIYIKFLIEYFGHAIEYDPSSADDLPKGFAKLSYQIDAVNDGFEKLKQYNGFFLSDVVGLGKTVIGAMIARKFFYANGFRTRTLVICPPALKDNWHETLEKFDLPNYRIESSGSLHKIIDPERYDLVLVDEAHKFRSDYTESFNLLQQICKAHCKNEGLIVTREDNHKRVILISATPLNNRPEDIRSLLYLFQDAKFATLEIGNLQHYFAGHIEKYKMAKNQPDLEQAKQQIKAIYEDIRRDIIAPLTVRRTRTDIKENEQYKKDLDAQGIRFPHVNPPRRIFYQLDADMDALYDDTTYLIGNKDDKGLTYARYQAIKYFLDDVEKPKFRYAELISDQLAIIMRTFLIKRLDSSFTAFKTSLRHFRDANSAMLRMFEQDKIFIVPDLKGKVTDFIMDEREDELEILVIEMMEQGKNAMICKSADFKFEYLDRLKRDQKILENLVDRWEKVEQDPKFDEFLKQLQKKMLLKTTNPEQKLVVFTESVVTAKYLHERLSTYPEYKMLVVSSANRKEMMEAVKANFDANAPMEKRRNDFNIVISTEVLAEGVNLHRANSIVNYDTPWNSTRLMQRIGRVNRIGSVADEVFVYNFYPTAKVENDIELQKKAFMKIQAFHTALGEDSQIYSTLEEFESHSLFRENVDGEKDRRLEVLMWLRRFKEENPERFRQIKNLPRRARCGRTDATHERSTIAYVKSGKRDNFFHIQPNNTVHTVSFLEAEAIFYALVNEKPVGLPPTHHQQIQQAIDAFEHEIKVANVSKTVAAPTLSKAEKDAINYIENFVPAPFVSEQDRADLYWAVDTIRAGVYTKLPRDINKLSKTAKAEKQKLVHSLENLLVIVRGFSKNTRSGENEEPMLPQPNKLRTFQPEIIISESFSALNT